MKHFLHKYTPELIISLIMILFLIGELVNNRLLLSDFRVYYDATKDFLQGGSVYGKSYAIASGVYKYSPFALLFFIPFTIFPFKVSAIVYFVFTIFIIVCLFRVLKSIYQTYFFTFTNRQYIIISLLTFLVLGDHFFTELHLGNINALLLLTALYSILLLLKGKNITAGILFACCVLFKPHFLLVLPLFIIRKEYKFLLAFITGLFAGLFIPILFVGIGQNNMLLSSWFRTILLHNSTNVDFYSNTTYHLIGIVLNNVGVFISEKILFVIITSVVGILFFSLWFKHHRRENAAERERNYLMEFFLLMSCIPNLMKTDTEHFLFSMPIIIFLLRMLITQKLPKLNIVLVIIGFIGYGGKWPDVIGKQICYFWNNYGFIGIGNFILIISAVLFYEKYFNKDILKQKNHKDCPAAYPEANAQ